MSRGWTQERRLAQANNIAGTKPWKNSTGPKSEEGKARSALNSYKHGLRGGLLRKASELLSANNKLMKELQK
jgi:hypothetical protein